MRIQDIDQETLSESLSSDLLETAKSKTKSSRDDLGLRNWIELDRAIKYTSLRVDDARDSANLDIDGQRVSLPKQQAQYLLRQLKKEFGPDKQRELSRYLVSRDFLDRVRKLLITEDDVDESLKSKAAAAVLAVAASLPGNIGGPEHPEARQPPSSSAIYDEPDRGVGNILVDRAQAAGISGQELAQLIAQTSHETGGYRAMVERGTAAYLEPDRRAGRRVGNRHEGDGYKFRGRGFIQLTGRGNYAAASRGLYGDDRLLKNPDLAADPEVAADIAVFYWMKRVRPKVSDWGDTRSVTRAVNGGQVGLGDRDRRFQEIWSTWPQDR